MQTTNKTEQSYKNGPRARSSQDAILDAAEELMSQRGFHGVGLREIARTAGANLGSVTYHFGTKENLLAAIYDRHCRPMNQRRLDLLQEARRISDRGERLAAIVRAFVVPAFSSGADVAGGGARFTRLRAVISVQGHEATRQIVADAFDETTHAFVEAVAECIPGAARESIVWRFHFLLGALYYTLVNADRVARLTDGKARGDDADTAIAELVRATVASLEELEE